MKKSLICLLCIIMCLAMFPLGAFAEDKTDGKHGEPKRMIAPYLAIYNEAAGTEAVEGTDYEYKNGDLYIYTDKLNLSGVFNGDIIIGADVYELSLIHTTTGSIIAEDHDSSFYLMLQAGSTVNGDIIYSSAEGYPTLALEIIGDNTVSGRITSNGYISILGNSDASLTAASLESASNIYVLDMVLSNVSENYIYGETNTLTPADSSKPIGIQIKTRLRFADEEEFIINDGNPIPYGTDYNIPAPSLYTLDYDPFEGSVELVYHYYKYEDPEDIFSITEVDPEDLCKKPVEEGSYIVQILISEDDPNYYGEYMYNFSIGHNIKLVPEQSASKTTPGTKAYYYCEGCRKHFKDAEGKEEITDFEKWKSVDGEGYIPPTGKGSSSGTVTSAKTSDNNSVSFWILVFTVSCSLVAACTVLRRKIK